ncbi:hypothetical protein FYZ45_08570 [Mobiluncus mulieris]|uniref:Uncharacterized protein n=1 Tax=Mobiluncus mulieris TaxID=2052 RepID=A0ABD4U1F6_9ACTO|nr:hypothetical protein [Mobiluncus mulieris]MCU9972528.1 hypothetical protein [Mobiluncus mulieris]MCV0009977.1 hypothetical protein [Mobiluncus mulieris]
MNPGDRGDGGCPSEPAQRFNRCNQNAKTAPTTPTPATNTKIIENPTPGLVLYASKIAPLIAIAHRIDANPINEFTDIAEPNTAVGNCTSPIPASAASSTAALITRHLGLHIPSMCIQINREGYEFSSFRTYSPSSCAKV